MLEIEDSNCTYVVELVCSEKVPGKDNPSVLLSLATGSKLQVRELSSQQGTLVDILIDMFYWILIGPERFIFLIFILVVSLHDNVQGHCTSLTL